MKKLEENCKKLNRVPLYIEYFLLVVAIFGMNKLHSSELDFLTLFPLPQSKINQIECKNIDTTNFIDLLKKFDLTANKKIIFQYDRFTHLNGLQNGIINKSLGFIDCCFEDKFLMDACHIQGNLVFNRCNLIRSFSFTDIIIKDSLTIKNSHFNDVVETSIKGKRINTLIFKNIISNNRFNITIGSTEIMGMSSFDSIPNSILKIRNCTFNDTTNFFSLYSSELELHGNTFTKRFNLKNEGEKLASLIVTHNTFNDVEIQGVEFDNEVSFSGELFKGLVIFDFLTFNKNVVFSNVTFDSAVIFKNTQFKSGLNFSTSVKFRANLIFDNVTFAGNIDFSNVQFDSTIVIKKNCTFCPGVKLNFSNSKINEINFDYDDLPDSLDFFNSTIVDEVYLHKIIKDEPNMTDSLTFCSINLTTKDIDKVNLFYHDFHLCFNKTDKIHKHWVYNKLLYKYQKEGMIYSHEKLNREYQAIVYTELDPHNETQYPVWGSFGKFFGKAINEANEFWWGYGYEKERMLFWTLIFFLSFTLINVFFGRFLNENIYISKNVTFLKLGCGFQKLYSSIKIELGSNKELLKTKNDKILSENSYSSGIKWVCKKKVFLVYYLKNFCIYSNFVWKGFLLLIKRFLNSLHYTVIIFFSLLIVFKRLKYSVNLNFRGAVSLIYILLVHVTGTISIAYLANYIFLIGAVPFL